MTTICSLTDSSAASAILGEFTQCAAFATPMMKILMMDHLVRINPSLTSMLGLLPGVVNSYLYPYISLEIMYVLRNSGSILICVTDRQSSTRHYA